MKCLFLWLCFLAIVMPLTAFEGTIAVSYTKGVQQHEMLLRVKGNKVWMTSKAGGNKKYAGYLCDLKTGDLFTVSAPGKKVILHYQTDSLLAFYETNGLKPGYQRHIRKDWKESDRIKVLNSVNAARYSSGDAEAWATDSRTPLQFLVPLLRLMDAWGECELQGKDVLEASSGVGQEKEALKVVITAMPVDDAYFQLPSDYKAVDFSKMMTEKRGDPQLLMLVKNFAGF